MRHCPLCLPAQCLWLDLVQIGATSSVFVHTSAWLIWAFVLSSDYANIPTVSKPINWVRKWKCHLLKHSFYDLVCTEYDQSSVWMTCIHATKPSESVEILGTERTVLLRVKWREQSYWELKRPNSPTITGRTMNRPTTLFIKWIYVLTSKGLHIYSTQLTASSSSRLLTVVLNTTSWWYKKCRL